MAAIGRDQTDTLLGYLPPVGWAEVATTRDIRALGSELRGELRAEIGGVRAEIGRLDGEIGRLDGEIGGLRGDMHHQFRLQLFWMVTLWVAGLGLLVGLTSAGLL